MTNIEKETKDMETIESVMSQMSDSKCWNYCECCIYSSKTCLRNCETGVREFLKQEAETK